mmetsp:Transcript_70275/g.197020  ORF Transcript_70275/g.197020 Transcript_70275/m.197020 type:complete len:202 (-) Transcript_70275:3-608(-)
MSVPYSSEGYFRGRGSPVSAAVSMLSTSPSSQVTSAGVKEPPRRWMTSPGTSCVTPMTWGEPSRRHVMVDSIWFVSSSSAFFAFISSEKPSKALTMSIAAMTPKSGQSFASAEITQLTSSMTGIVPVNCLRSIFHTGVTAAGISFGPNSSSSSAALSEVRPVRAPPALIFPKVSLSTNFCWSAMVRGRRERLTMDLANKLA